MAIEQNQEPFIHPGLEDLTDQEVETRIKDIRAAGKEVVAVLYKLTKRFNKSKGRQYDGEHERLWTDIDRQESGVRYNGQVDFPWQLHRNVHSFYSELLGRRINIPLSRLHIYPQAYTISFNEGNNHPEDTKCVITPQGELLNTFQIGWGPKSAAHDLETLRALSHDNPMLDMIIRLTEEGNTSQGKNAADHRSVTLTLPQTPDGNMLIHTNAGGLNGGAIQLGLDGKGKFGIKSNTFSKYESDIPVSNFTAIDGAQLIRDLKDVIDTKPLES